MSQSSTGNGGHGDLEPVQEVICPRCKGTCEDRHGEPCTHCEGMGTTVIATYRKRSGRPT